MPTIRRPTVAGQFYESDAEALRAQIRNCFLNKIGPQKLPEINMHSSPRNIVGMICPHAGYVYSGPVAASAYYELAQDGKPDTVVLMGPNHTGYGSALAMMRQGGWQTPLGSVEIDTELADQITHETNIIDVDEFAHRYEHSIEVQLPFLQFLYGNTFKIVPICFLMQDYDSAVEVGRALDEALDATNTVVIASSDMTHYERAETAAAKDNAALKAVTELDAKRFYETIEEHNITACGYAPITALITYANGVCAEAQLLNYHNSGDITGDHSSVVGYAAVIFKKSART
ncbi:MAG TPA: AmmeMemoRadiSam system protein B [Candidatus Limnocylindrales bacterium]|nr:AmmeMemoRadiSam system protein B [Candidatus Limnocylindrales bacterium]